LDWPVKGMVPESDQLPLLALGIDTVVGLVGLGCGPRHGSVATAGLRAHWLLIVRCEWFLVGSGSRRYQHSVFQVFSSGAPAFLINIQF